jgi:predicted NBD/HSP70 family sugar kinase
MVLPRMRTSYSGLFWGQDAAVASSSMGGCSTDRAALAANGVTTPFPGANLPECWCGRRGCLETWVSGPGITADHARLTGKRHTAKKIAARAERGDYLARTTLSRHADRLARGLAHVVNITYPDVVVLGGGLCKFSHLYEQLPNLMRPHIFADQCSLPADMRNVSIDVC